LNYKGYHNAKPEIVSSKFDALEESRKRAHSKVRPRTQSAEGVIIDLFVKLKEAGIKNLAFPRCLHRGERLKGIPFGEASRFFINESNIEGEGLKRDKILCAYRMIHEFVGHVNGLENYFVRIPFIKILPKLYKDILGDIRTLILSEKFSFPKNFFNYSPLEKELLSQYSSNYEMIVVEFLSREGFFPIPNFLKAYDNKYHSLAKDIRKLIPEYSVTMGGIWRKSADFYLKEIQKLFSVSGVGRPIVEKIYGEIYKLPSLELRVGAELTLWELVTTPGVPEPIRFSNLNREMNLILKLNERLRKEKEEVSPEEEEDFGVTFAEKVISHHLEVLEDKKIDPPKDNNDLDLLKSFMSSIKNDDSDNESSTEVNPDMENIEEDINNEFREVFDPDEYSDYFSGRSDNTTVLSFETETEEVYYSGDAQTNPEGYWERPLEEDLSLRRLDKGD